MRPFNSDSANLYEVLGSCRSYLAPIAPENPYDGGLTSSGILLRRDCKRVSHHYHHTKSVTVLLLTFTVKFPDAVFYATPIRILLSGEFPTMVIINIPNGNGVLKAYRDSAHQSETAPDMYW